MASENVVVGTCPACRVHVIAREAAHVLYDDGPSAPVWRFSILMCSACGGPLVIYGEDGHSFEDPIWLYPSLDDASGVIPVALRVELGEAKKLALSGFVLPAAVMCGRVLEGLAQDHGIKENSLIRSLEKLRALGLIPAEMLEWGQELRVLRNHAAHFGGGPITREDIDDAIALVEAMLEYVFVFAWRFQSFKARRNVN